MARAKLTVRTFTAKSRPSRLAVLPGRTVAAIRRRQAENNCRYLIYKLPVLRRSGTAARLFCLHIPVETDTPPYSAWRRRGGFAQRKRDGLTFYVCPAPFGGQ